MSVGFVWISLDSLVRNETYQWVTLDFRWKFFLGASRPFEAPDLAACARCAAEGHDVHGASLIVFLFFCNQLPALIAIPVACRRDSPTFRFFVMAGLDPAIHEDTEPRQSNR
jgi:hypothetical protein